jgi:photosystem II stability/assembly factor-like uncharacterized protein
MTTMRYFGEALDFGNRSLDADSSTRPPHLKSTGKRAFCHAGREAASNSWLLAISSGFTLGNVLRMTCLAVLLTTTSWCVQAQWTLQNSNTTADLRGIHSVGNGVAWASGTNGTVLRTEDDGYLWQTCTIPPGAEKLDFRGLQAFDANTAIVMSSGKGDLSRLYKTIDGCHTWKLLITNPYAPDGFFDAILFLDSQHGLLFGDPSPLNLRTPVEYEDNFRLRVTANGGNTWGPVSSPDAPPKPGNGLHALPDESAFAASNSSIAARDGWLWFATSAGRVAFRRLYEGKRPPGGLFQSAYCAGAIDPVSRECGQPWIDFQNSTAPVVHSSPSSGIFSIWFATPTLGVAVGGDYLKPDDASGSAAFTADGGKTWQAAKTPPHGYRSSVACDASKTWITVGPNGTDISTDDGKNWRPLHPDSAVHEAPDVDRNWNAISLPFVVGPHGRIGKLNPAALKQ